VLTNHLLSNIYPLAKFFIKSLFNGILVNLKKIKAELCFTVINRKMEIYGILRSASKNGEHKSLCKHAFATDLLSEQK